MEKLNLFSLPPTNWKSIVCTATAITTIAIATMFFWPTQKYNFTNKLLNLQNTIEQEIKSDNNFDAKLNTLIDSLQWIKREIIKDPKIKILPAKTTFSWGQLIFNPAYKLLEKVIYIDKPKNVKSSIVKILWLTETISYEFNDKNSPSYNAELDYSAQEWVSKMHELVDSNFDLSNVLYTKLNQKDSIKENLNSASSKIYSTQQTPSLNNSSPENTKNLNNSINSVEDTQKNNLVGQQYNSAQDAQNNYNNSAPTNYAYNNQANNAANNQTDFANNQNGDNQPANENMPDPQELDEFLRSLSPNNLENSEQKTEKPTQQNNPAPQETAKNPEQDKKDSPTNIYNNINLGKKDKEDTPKVHNRYYSEPSENSSKTEDPNRELPTTEIMRRTEEMKNKEEIATIKTMENVRNKLIETQADLYN